MINKYSLAVAILGSFLLYLAVIWELVQTQFRSEFTGGIEYLWIVIGGFIINWLVVAYENKKLIISSILIYILVAIFNVILYIFIFQKNDNAHMVMSLICSVSQFILIIPIIYLQIKGFIRH